MSMTSNATPKGNERLRTLYAVMGGVPDEKVDMNNWRRGSGAWDDRNLLETECGTSACAVGWACAYPEFQAQGLRFNGAPLLRKGKKWLEGWGAVEKFFGVDEVTSGYLFATSEVGKAARLGVMKRIRTVLLDRGVISQERNVELFRMEQTL